jgi:hypothetical protein
MLKLAYTYQDKLNQVYNSIIFQDKYKYYNYDNYWGYTKEVSKDSWNDLEFVSVDKNDNVIGYLRAGISRSADKISTLGIMNFYDINVTFSKDLYQFLNELFIKFNFRKIEFTVVIGNPAEKMYDKYIEKYGGRIVGTRRQSTRLQDNKYYDVKEYEIFREDYLKYHQ